MSHTIKKRKLYQLLKLQEYSYRRLVSLVPGLKLLSGTLMLRDDEHARFTLELLEQCKYTTLLSLRHYFDRSMLIPDMEMNVRICHDAAVAEVVSYQGKGRMQPIYEYPNPGMYQRDEKFQHNRLLADWLTLCADRQYVLIHTDIIPV